MFTNLEEYNYSTQQEKDEIAQLHNTLISLISTFIPILIIIVLTALQVITTMTGAVLVVFVILILYIYNLYFHLFFSNNTTTTTNTDKHANLQRLHRQLHSGPGYGDGLGNTNRCPNGLPVWENYLRKYGLLYDDLGNRQSVPDDGIKYIVVEYNTPTGNDGISLSEIQVWESSGTTSSTDTTNNDYIVSGLTNIAPQATIDVTTGFITNNDDNSDLSGNKPDSCATFNLPEDVYYHSHGSQGRHSHNNNRNRRRNQRRNHLYNHYGPHGSNREPIDDDHYNDDHDPTTHTHNLRNARPIHDYHHDDHGHDTSVTHRREHRALYDQHIEDHYLEGMTSGDSIKTTLTNNNFSDQYLNIVVDASNETIVQQETIKMGLHTSKNHDELYVVRLITPTTLMNATVSLLNGNQEVLYSKNIKENANVYTLRLGASGSESNINTAIDNYDSSYTQKSYEVCNIPQNRRQYAIQHRSNNPNNNMDCTTETFVSTINLKPLTIKASPITRDLI